MAQLVMTLPKRPDANINSNCTAQTALETSSQPELRLLSVTESDHEIVITGHVRSFYMKAMAQETVRPKADEKTIINNVEVLD